MSYIAFYACCCQLTANCRLELVLDREDRARSYAEVLGRPVSVELVLVASLRERRDEERALRLVRGVASSVVPRQACRVGERVEGDASRALQVV